MFSILDSFSRTLASRGMVEGRKEMQMSTDVLNSGLLLQDSCYQRYGGGSEGDAEVNKFILNHGLLLLESC